MLLIQQKDFHTTVLCKYAFFVGFFCMINFKTKTTSNNYVLPYYCYDVIGKINWIFEWYSVTNKLEKQQKKASLT